MRRMVVILAAGALAVVSAFGLSACGGEAAKGPIYLPSKSTTYYSDGSMLSESTYEYDEHGNVLKQTYKSAPVYDKSDIDTNVLEYSGYDEYGYYSTMTSGDGDVSTYEWTIEDGHAVKSVGNGKYETEYAYYDDGKLKSEISQYGSERTTVEYDEDGRYLGMTSEGSDYPSTTRYTWQVDEEGNVSGYTYTSHYSGSDATTSSYSTQCDENGNVTYVYDAEDGTLWKQIEYVKIDNPSTYAWIQSFSKLL